jgi:hypothetical protein
VSRVNLDEESYKNKKNYRVNALNGLYPCGRSLVSTGGDAGVLCVQGKPNSFLVMGNG